MNALFILIGVVLGALLSYSLIKPNVEILESQNNSKDAIIKDLFTDNENYYNIKLIVNSKGLIVDKYDKIKELVDKDN